LTRALYGALLASATPIYLAELWRRGGLEPAWRRGWRERFALDLPPPGPYIWIHAVSLGEMLAAAPLVSALYAAHRNERMLVTCATPAGLGAARAAFGDAVHVCWLPLDHAWCVRRFVASVRPRLCALVETELWPNLLAALDAAGVPAVVVNASLSEASLRRYRRLRLFRDAAATLHHVAAQDPSAAERFRRLGAPHVSVAGHLKLDCEPAPARPHARPCWIAASVRPGEEAAVLDAHARLLAARPDALLVLAPRHRDRFEPVADAAKRRWRVARRSRGEAPASGTQVLLVDTLGELRTLYELGDLAFVGGSLAPHGGHNPAEAAACSLPVLMGPSLDGVGAAVSALGEGLRVVRDAPELGRAVVELVADPAARARMSAAARAGLAAHRGAVRRNLSVCEAALADSLPS